MPFPGSFESALQDPISLAVYVTLVTLAWLGVWCAASVPGTFLFFAFDALYRGRRMFDGVRDLIAGWFGWLGARWMDVWRSIAKAYATIVNIKAMRVVLVERVEALRKKAAGAGREVRDQLNRYNTALRGAAGAGLGVNQRLREVVSNVENLQKQLMKSIHLNDLNELIDRHTGGGVAWFRAILFTLLAAAVIVVNTFLLYEFFRGLITFSIPFVAVPIALVFAVLYTFLEFGFGLALEVENEKQKREREDRRKANPADDGVGFSAGQAVYVVFIVAAVAVEFALYGILSFGIAWPWPPEVAERLPWWADGWLALLGLIIGGGVAAAGYNLGDQGHAVIRSLELQSLRDQASYMNDKLKQLPGQIVKVRTAAGLAEGSGTGKVSEEVDHAEKSAETRIGRLLQNLKDELTELERTKPSDVADASADDAQWRRMLTLGAPILAILVCGGNGLMQAVFISRTPIAMFGPIAVAGAAVVYAVIALACGRLFNAPYHLGYTNRAEHKADAEDGGGQADGAAEAAAGRKQDHENRVAELDSGGYQLWIGVVLAATILAFGMWTASAGIRPFSIGLVLLSVVLNIASFALGYWLDPILRGFAFYFRALAWLLFGAAPVTVAILALSLIWLFGAILWLAFGVVWAALWILSWPARRFWEWLTNLGKRAARGGGAGGGLGGAAQAHA